MDYGKMKEGMSSGTTGGKHGFKQGEAHGPGGLKSAKARNPNKHSNLNGAPCGPYSHCMGYTGDGGVHGDETATGKHGEKYYFK